MNMNLIILIIAVFFNACGKDEHSTKPAEPLSAEASETKTPESKDPVVVEPKEDEPPLQANEWVDPVTEKRWLLGAVNSYEIADKSCTGKYRLATADEGIAAANHGILTIARGLNLSTDFWIKATKEDKAYINVSAIRFQNNLPEAQAGIFCIKS